MEAEEAILLEAKDTVSVVVMNISGGFVLDSLPRN